ncbi:MAG: extracellular solute-binding protein [Alphaproteobacteria bacterium]
MRATALAVLLLAFASATTALAADTAIRPRHGIAIHGEPGYPADFKHFRYVNPDAPKGGDVRLSAFGTYDNFNGFILKGVSAAGLNHVFETLMVSAADEANTEYGLIAESVETPPDRSWVIFNLRPQARFHDGKPITADDVVFSFETFKSKGHPYFRAYYANVVKAEKLDRLKVKFTFKGGENRELPVIMGQLTVIPKHYWEGRDFTKTTLEPPLGSGPYRIEAFDAGRSITYRRIPDYWAEKLPVNVGRENFDSIRYDYYTDRTVQREAFKAGAFDVFEENTAKEWALSYDFPALRAGLVKKEAIPNELPTGMQAFVFNTRRAIFKDARVRRALGYAFDFEWTNKVLFFGQYKRTKSYFSNSDLASSGLPLPGELAILERYRGRIPDQVFTEVYEPPTTDGSGNIRDNLREAFRLLKEAGWIVRDGKLVNAETGKPFEFEVLLAQAAFERVLLAYKRNLKRLGIEMRVRTVDTAQYQRRVEYFDFDMIVGSFGQSLSPGNEQRDFWGSLAADTPGSKNEIGIKDPVVDELIDLIISAPDRQSLIDRTRALDRALLWGFYVVPNWHIGVFRVLWWDKFGRPAIVPKYTYGFDTWWVDRAKDEALAARRGEFQQTKKP